MKYTQWDINHPKTKNPTHAPISALRLVRIKSKIPRHNATVANFHSASTVGDWYDIIARASGFISFIPELVTYKSVRYRSTPLISAIANPNASTRRERVRNIGIIQNRTMRVALGTSGTEIALEESGVCIKGTIDPRCQVFHPHAL